MTVEYYTGLIKEIRSQKEESPRTAEEASSRLIAARDLYEDLPAPAVSMPDSQPRTLKDLVADREAQYWLERGEVRESKDVVFRTGFDTGVQDRVYRLMANLVDDVPSEVLAWGVAKTVVADKVMEAIRNMAPFDNTGQSVDVDEILGSVNKKDLSIITSGKARILIKDGKPVIFPLNTETAGQALGREIERRHLSWEERHKILTRSSKLRKIIPFMADLAGARSGNQLSDIVQFNIVHHLTNHPKPVRQTPSTRERKPTSGPKPQHSRSGSFIASQFENLLG